MNSVIEGIEIIGGAVNTAHDVLLDNIRSSIRRGHPQLKEIEGIQRDAVVLVCGGPSLNDTLPELRECLANGLKVVTVNGAYNWCIERNIIPSLQIVMDARATNVRFLSPALPRCHYMLASQCDPALWDAVEGRPSVWIYHVGVNDETVESKKVLDDYYLGQWHALGGGTTVGTRAIFVLRTLGYYRMEVFGMDSCWMGSEHHAYAQPENSTDKNYAVTMSPKDHPDMARVFNCAPWHIQQLEDFLQMVRVNGQHFALNMHGNGLLAFALSGSAEVQDIEERR